MVAEEPVEPQLLAQLLEVAPAKVEELCASMAAAYEADERGFVLVRVAGGYRFQSHPDLAPYVERFVLEGQSARLSSAALETLAIIAYKQPISRAQIASIRGVNVDGVVRTLEQRGFIEEVARDPGPGQATLYGTTRTFLERLGLDSVDQLPALGQFVPGPDVVEALEHGLRACAPTLDAPATTSSRSGRRAPPPDDRSRVASRDDPAELAAEAEGERLQKVLARAGIGSRRICEILIDDGAVTINGRVALLGDRVDVDADAVEVHGVRIGVAPGLVYYLLHKPVGVVTTAAESAGSADGRRPGARRTAGVPGGPARSRHRGPAAVDQRRRADPPADPPVLRRGQGVPGPCGRPAVARRPAPAARGRRARRRHHRAGNRRARQRRPLAPRDPRGAQPPGPAHVRGRRPPGGAPGAHPHRHRSPTASCSRGPGGSSTVDEVRALERAVEKGPTADKGSTVDKRSGPEADDG